MRKSLSLIALAALTLLGSAASAAASPITVTYTFTGSPGNQLSEPVDAQVAGITASDITRGPGLTAIGGMSSINSVGWTTAAVPDPLDYYEVSLTLDPGYTFTLNSLAQTQRRSATGPTNLQIMYSTDGFVTQSPYILFPLFGTGNFCTTVPLPLNLHNHGWVSSLQIGATGPAGTYRLGLDLGEAGTDLPNNLEITGDLTRVAAPVPEPASLMLLGTCLVAAEVARYRRRR